MAHVDPEGRSLPRMDHAPRLERVRDAMRETGHEALLVTRPANVRYLSGFSGDGMLVVLLDDAVLLTDARYAERAESDNQAGATVVVTGRIGQVAAIGEAAGDVGAIAFESGHVTMAFHALLTEGLPARTFVASARLVEGVRLVKDAGEIARMQAAAAIADAALAEVQPLLAGGVSERQLARRLEGRMGELGSDERSFSTLVGSGPNSSKPHAEPTSRVIEQGEPVVVDFGATVDGYRSDMTRTIWWGELSGPVRPLYEAVLEANAAGVVSAAVGVTHEDVDRACREVLDGAGLAEAFVHPSGHNIGLEVHELPYLVAGATDELRAGQVVTVEPGAYVAGVGGARVEDMVVVGANGARLLTTAPRSGPSDRR